jgi:uncharacterized protein YuzE
MTLKIRHFEKEDILHLVISDEAEANSIELGPNITAELKEKGELIGVEILNATTFLRDSIMESIKGFEARLETLEDLAVIAERRDEPTISHEALKTQLIRDGLLPN